MNFPLISMYPDTSRLTRFIGPLAARISTQEELIELKNLINNKKSIFEKVSQSVGRAFETIEINIQWKTNNYEELSHYLSQMSKGNFSYDSNSILNIDSLSLKE